MEKHRGFVHGHFRLTILTDRCCLYAASKKVGHKLRTIADTKDRNSQFKNFFGASRRLLSIYTAWSSGKNNALRVHLFNVLKAHAVRVYLTIYITFSDTSGDQLIILPAEVKYDNCFSFHAASPLSLSIVESIFNHAGQRKKPLFPSLLHIIICYLPKPCQNYFQDCRLISC